jgi:hypothetical protein
MSPEYFEVGERSTLNQQGPKVSTLLVQILCPFNDWARDAGIVCCETPSEDH